MRKYWIHYYRSFGNTFALYYTESAEEEKYLPANAERITRKDALKMARREGDSRKFDGAFSGFADAEIYPVNSPEDIINDRRYKLVGRIWEKVGGGKQ